MLSTLGIAAASALIITYFLPTQNVSKRLLFILSFLISSIVVAVVQIIIAKITFVRKEKALGCRPTHKKPQRFWGVPDIARMLNADKRDEVPEEFVKIQGEVGYTTFEHSFFGSRAVFTIDPKNVQAILATQFNDFSLGEQRRGNFFPMLGNGIFTADGKAWEHSRALIRPQFTRDQVSDLELEEAHVEALLQHIPVQSDGWTAEVNLAPIFFRLTLDSATEFLFGHSVHSQISALPGHTKVKSKDGDDLEWENMARAFDSATHHLGMRARYSELYWLHSPKSFHEDCKEVHRFADYYVDLALKTDLSALDDTQRQSALEKGQHKPRYVFLQELVKVTRDRTELRSQLLNILLAGRDTTAGLLGWTFWLLAQHPEIYAKLRKTILESFGPYSTDTSSITFTTLKSNTYLQAVMSEVLRLYPSVPLNTRRSTRDTSIPRGGGPDGTSPVYIPKGTEVNYAVHVMHRSTTLWGPDAREFKPERFTGRKSGWEYLPFNGGPRICLGQQFALTETGYVIVRLVQRFEELEFRGSKEVKHQYSITTAPRAVWLRLKEAEVEVKK